MQRVWISLPKKKTKKSAKVNITNRTETYKELRIHICPRNLIFNQIEYTYKKKILFKPSIILQ